MIPVDRQGRCDRFYVLYESAPHTLHSLRTSAYDSEPMDREEAVRRFGSRNHGVLVEIVPVARRYAVTEIHTEHFDHAAMPGRE